jgi:hypothetical protein
VIDAVAVGPLLRRSEPPRAWHLCGDVDAPPPRACRGQVQQQRRPRHLARPSTNGPVICARSRLLGAKTMELFHPRVCFVFGGWMTISYSGGTRKGSRTVRLKRRSSTAGVRFRASCIAARVRVSRPGHDHSPDRLPSSRRRCRVPFPTLPTTAPLRSRPRALRCWFAGSVPVGMPRRGRR